MAERLLWKRNDGKWTWHLKANNGQVIATDGSQGYENESDCPDIADRLIGGEFGNAEKRIKRPL